ncbi:LysR family transcriptional regulator [Thalassobacter stenotrophicus]|uniref:D-malate degradation protein R n=2 Tax=Thalassobacter stenotrophicus TaxID=266809 RepID=A0A0P1F269_9RHOB|nr:LysR family transcriptional regulator [Thalassobacter stenotrophicus]CUH61581.1 D-malate degradation protein R [Thalassobacter stenotrophicus]SHJ35202.1 DNA-binding transcriptional regulator, LysR family [Thalassobacter stenotrophicus DSM 16310]
MKDDRLLEMRVYQAVVATGAFTAAAHSLGVSQPFVSQTIQRLEKRLGVKLMHRTTRGHRLTPDGERFLDVARRVLDAVEAAESDWQISDAQVDGLLRVSVPIAFGLDRITSVIPGFLERHPKLSLEMRLTDDSERLIDDQIDVAIRMGTLSDSSLMHRRLCGLQRIVVATPALVARHGLPTRPADLAAFPCLAWDGGRAHLNRWRFIEDGKDVIFQAESRFRSNQGMSLYQMCLVGMGAMRAAEHLARPAIADGRLVQLLPDHTALDDTAIYAVFLPDRHMVPRIRSFIDFMVDTFRSPDWEATGPSS